MLDIDEAVIGDDQEEDLWRALYAGLEAESRRGSLWGQGPWRVRIERAARYTDPIP